MEMEYLATWSYSEGGGAASALHAALEGAQGRGGGGAEDLVIRQHNAAPAFDTFTNIKKDMRYLTAWSYLEGMCCTSPLYVLNQSHNTNL